MSNLARQWEDPVLPSKSYLFLRHSGVRVTGLCRSAFVDALVSRQKAFGLLNGALKNIDSIGDDIVLAAVLFFINFDLIDYGTKEWKAHLDGAVKIMRQISPEDRRRVIPSSSLSDYVVSDCFM
jgi:Fungal specific transcription factor domain